MINKSGKILFARYRERMCALLVRDNRLLAAQVLSDTANRIGAVYIGKIKNVVKNIDACFLEIAGGEICFLSMKDAQHPVLLNRQSDGRLLQGDELLVQISCEAQKNKQASVTAEISLSNEYAAISIGSRRIGYSGKLDKVRREEIKNWLTQSGFLQGNNFVPEPVTATDSDADHHLIPNVTNGDLIPLGLVVRTKAHDCTEETLLQNIRALLDNFQTMIQNARHRTCFSCIRQAPEDFEAVLDQLAYPHEYEEIVTDDAVLYEKLSVYCKEKLPDKQVRLYEDSNLSLSKLYSLEQKLDTALNKRIWLKSGGYLIMEHTEALTVIDVNSGKYVANKASTVKASQNTRGTYDITISQDTKLSHDTYETINWEAAEEIALQLRLRNLSGIIVVDFINMSSKESEEALLEALRELVHRDKIKTTVVDMTPLGLVEITRKKRNKPLREQFDEKL